MQSGSTNTTIKRGRKKVVTGTVFGQRVPRQTRRYCDLVYRTGVFGRLLQRQICVCSGRLVLSLQNDYSKGVVARNDESHLTQDNNKSCPFALSTRLVEEEVLFKVCNFVPAPKPGGTGASFLGHYIMHNNSVPACQTSRGNLVLLKRKSLEPVM
jgi:hypothetical protein